MKKMRLDVLLVERGLVTPRAKAQGVIMAGDVFVDGQRCDKAGTRFDPEEVTIEVRSDDHPFASRGGLKLEAALKRFEYDVTGAIVLDVGASTGGFTDCVLQRGAARVYAVDVGYGQIAWKLRTDARVINIERTNIRHMEPGAIEEACDLAVIDCSFISLDQVLPNTLTFLKPAGDVIALIKPQFEVAPEDVAQGGVVRDEDARARAIEQVTARAEALGLTRQAGIDCPVHGPAGNVEYLIWLRRIPLEDAPDDVTGEQE